MNTIPSETTVLAWARLLKAQRLALARVEAALKRSDLPPLAWYDVLLELERAGAEGLRPYELERAMLLAQYNLSRVLDRIEAAGLLRRDPHPSDGRGQVLRITDSGRALRRRMWRVYGEAIHDALGRHLGKADAGTLGVVLGKLIEGLDANGRPAEATARAARSGSTG